MLKYLDFLSLLVQILVSLPPKGRAKLYLNIHINWQEIVHNITVLVQVESFV